MAGNVIVAGFAPPWVACSVRSRGFSAADLGGFAIKAAMERSG